MSIVAPTLVVVALVVLIAVLIVRGNRRDLS